MLLALAPTRIAHADEDPETLIHQGISMRKQGNDVAAYGYFERAYQMARTPRTAAQLGLVELALEHLVEAQLHLSEALSSSVDPWVEKNRLVLDQSRESARKRLGQIKLVGIPATATVSATGQATAPVPADGILWVAPGNVDLTLSAPGHEAVTKQAQVAAGDSVLVSITLPEIRKEAPKSDQPVTPGPEGPTARIGSRQARIAGLITSGVGLAIGVAGIFVYEAGASKLGAIKADARTAGTPYNPANGSYETLGNAGIGLMVAGGLCVATGTAIYLLYRGEEPHHEGGVPDLVNVSWGYSPGSGGHILIGGSF
jgi:hypothetical protein